MSLTCAVSPYSETSIADPQRSGQARRRRLRNGDAAVVSDFARAAL